MTISEEAITCSAPGKILLAGGYLVLDSNYTGLVLSLSARIYTTIIAGSKDKISVYSPQFKDAYWQYTYEEGDIREGNVKNPFVREALQTCLSYFRPAGTTFDICIFADNQYYSLEPSSGRFASSQKSIAETPKTGLGSSAALVTSLCAALFQHLSGRDVSSSLDGSEQQIIHNLAQISHCRAQGKVGSGFDVASAVYGSCLYSRFPANLIEDLPKSSENESAALRAVVDSTWPITAERSKLRPGLSLMMGDVEQGSSTPGMVKKVQGSAAALDIWPSLGISNDLLAEYLTGETPYDASEESKIREASQSVRGLLKQMGTIAEVEIEPDSQTAVLDKTLAIPGVIACGVPGAGGYDAIYAIVDSKTPAQDAVRQLWRENHIKALLVHDDGKGIQIEKDFDIRGCLTGISGAEGYALRDYLEASRKARSIR